MVSISQTTNDLQRFCEFILLLKVICESVIDGDNNCHGDTNQAGIG